VMVGKTSLTYNHKADQDSISLVNLASGALERKRGFSQLQDNYKRRRSKKWLFLRKSRGRPVLQDFSDYVKGFGFAFAVLNHAKKFR
jgi:hypothetical protein